MNGDGDKLGTEVIRFSNYLRPQLPSLLFFSLLTRFGEVSIIWIDTGTSSIVRRIFLSSEKGSASALASTAFPGISPGLNHHIRRIADEIDVMLSGGIPKFNIRILDFSVCSVFQRKVLMEERNISRGEVRSYGWLADRIGKPGTARAVGNALASNPFPLVIPCHRAVRSDGRIGGFQGGPAMKRDLLEMEGIFFNPSGRVQSEILQG